MKIIKGILITLVLLAIIITVVGFLSPRMMHVERSIIIHAPAEIIHQQINDLKKWEKWSPWYKMDTAMKMDYSGTTAGAGASYKWESSKMGKGDMTIISSTADSISTALNMEYGSAFIKFLFAKSDSNTKITWIMESDKGMNPVARFMCLFMNGMVGKDFEKGLTNLKQVAEAIPTGPKKYRGYEVMEIDSPEKVFIVKKDSIPWNKISEFYQKTLPALYEAIAKAKLEMDGAPSGLYFKWDSTNKTTLMAAGIPVKGDAKTKVKGYETVVVPSGSGLHITYHGGYNKIANAHFAMSDYMKEKNLLQGSPVIEEYVTDPMGEKDSTKWITNIYYPVE